MSNKLRSPLLEHDHNDHSAFLPRNLLEMVRVRKELKSVVIQEGCLLDFGDELLEHLATMEPDIINENYYVSRQGLVLDTF